MSNDKYFGSDFNYNKKYNTMIVGELIDTYYFAAKSKIFNNPNIKIVCKCPLSDWELRITSNVDMILFGKSVENKVNEPGIHAYIKKWNPRLIGLIFFQAR